MKQRHSSFLLFFEQVFAHKDVLWDNILLFTLRKQIHVYSQRLKLLCSLVNGVEVANDLE